MINFKAAIFDLDGTLIDSRGVWEKIDVDFLAGRGIEVPGDYIEAVGALVSFEETARYTIERFGLSDSVPDLIAEWNRMACEEYARTVRLKPYVREYLEALKARGVKLATATALSDCLSAPVLENNGVLGLFDALCSTDETGRGKMFPDVFLLAARKLGAQPGECAVFEDTRQGIASAKAAGMKAFCVYDGQPPGQLERLREAADGFIRCFREAPLPGCP